MKRTGFTLVELLIVVAIIAILAAIAVPNLLEAQIRAKVSRVRSDLRTLATALEAYAVENNAYPRSNPYSNAVFCPDYPAANQAPALERLTTPVAFLSGGGGFQDPFPSRFRYCGAALNDQESADVATPDQRRVTALYKFQSRGVNLADNAGCTSIWNAPTVSNPKWWILESAGPDACYHNLGASINTMTRDDAEEAALAAKTLYDATNGSVSRGSLWRVGGGGALQPGIAFFRAVVQSTP